MGSSIRIHNSLFTMTKCSFALLFCMVSFAFTQRAEQEPTQGEGGRGKPGRRNRVINCAHFDDDSFIQVVLARPGKCEGIPFNCVAEDGSVSMIRPFECEGQTKPPCGGGFCSDGSDSNRSACKKGGNTWTLPGECSNSSITDAKQCMTMMYEWICPDDTIDYTADRRLQEEEDCDKEGEGEDQVNGEHQQGDHQGNKGGEKRGKNHGRKNRGDRGDEEADDMTGDEADRRLQEEDCDKEDDDVNQGQQGDNQGRNNRDNQDGHDGNQDDQQDGQGRRDRDNRDNQDDQDDQQDDQEDQQDRRGRDGRRGGRGGRGRGDRGDEEADDEEQEDERRLAALYI